MTQRTTELRHLTKTQKHEISLILDECDSWKILMSIVPKQFDALTCSENGGLNVDKLIADVGLKYTNEHISQLSVPRQGDGRLCSEIFLDEWATSGQKNNRPTLGILLQLLVKAELFAAADYIAELLCEPSPERPLRGPAARIDISLPSEILNEVASFANDSAFYPNTEDISVNAKASNGVGDNNQDFFTKFRHDEKNWSIIENGAPKPAPRTHRKAERLLKMEQSQSGQIVTTTLNGSINGEREHQMEMISPETSGHSSPSEQNQTNASTEIPLLSLFRSSEKSNSVAPSTESTNIESSVPIPLLSALQETQTVKSDAVMTDIQSLPVISALNINGINDSEHHINESQQNGICANEFEEDASNEISDDNDDNDENSLRNLGSSNNDSSLTNVTGTSGESSFELSSNSTSNENIPLNVLQY